MPQYIPATCECFGEGFLIKHALSCPKGVLVLAQHDDAAKEWGALGPRDLIPSSITYEPKIKSVTVQGERNRSAAQQEGRTAKGSTENLLEAQGGSGQTVNMEARLVESTGQVEVPTESRADISANRFWKQGNTTMFDIRIFNLDAGSYLRMTPEKDLSKAEKEKKDLYLQDYLERRRNFTQLVYSADRIPRAESLAAKERLAALLSYKLNQ